MDEAIKLVDDNARKSSGVYSVNGFVKKIPALFTRASTEPNRSTAVPRFPGRRGEPDVAVHQGQLVRALQLVL